MLILNGVVHPMDGPVIPRGFVAFEGEINLRRGPCAPAVVEVTHVRIARDERQRPYRYLL